MHLVFISKLDKLDIDTRAINRVTHLSPKTDMEARRKSSICALSVSFSSDPTVWIILLAHLSRRLIGELIGYSWSGVRPSSVVVRPSSTMLKDLLRNRFANQSQILCGASLGRENDILFAESGSHDQDGRHAHIWSKPFKIFFSRTFGSIFTKLGM